MHKKQLEFLKNSISNNKIPQAIVFSGVDGIGKKQVALEFVKMINKGKVLERDLILISPNGKEIQIAQIRALQRDLSFKPQFAETKSVIIDKAETMNPLAQNCFLKTLEEPKTNALFILITSKPRMLLPTIASRCVFLKFFRTQPQVLEQEKQKQILDLLKKDLSGRFAFTKEFFNKNTTQSEAEEFLDNLIFVLRKMFLSDLFNNTQPEKLKTVISDAVDLNFMFKNTNINKRLGFENLMLKLS